MLQNIHNRWQRSRAAPVRSPLDEGLAITIRHAYPDDSSALHHLAALDSRPVPDGPLLVAEVSGELWAAVAIAGDAPAIADPFRYTAALVELLRDRAARLAHPQRRAAGGPLARPTSSVAWR